MTVKDDNSPRVGVIIAAGGRGVRFGGNTPKQWLTLDGRSLLDRSVAAFDLSGVITEIVVCVPAETVEQARRDAPKTDVPVRFVAGGARRQDSVANGFDAARPDVDVLLIHDAARPLVTPDIIERTIDAAWESGAAIAALPVHDTVKQASTSASGDTGDAIFIERTLPRETLHLAQTPQGFRRDVLAAAIAVGRGGAGPDGVTTAGVDATDEAALAERAGHRVRLVMGSADNFKITTAEDLQRAAAVLAARAAHAPHLSERPSAPPMIRIGLGYDLHRLVEGRPLILGGVRLAHERGLLGHSDADAVCHAVTDALLGASNLGDIGRLFPDTDPRWKDADSLKLLADAYARVRAAGWVIVNLDIVVIAQRVKISPHAPAIAETLARALDVSASAIAIKGKTNEGVDAVGQGDALAVHAVALLHAK